MVVLIVRIVIMVVVGGGGMVLLAVGVRQYRQQKRLLRDAKPIEVEIIEAKVFSSRSREVGKELLRDRSTTTYLADIRFRYRVDGTDYESDLLRPTIIAVTSASHEAAAAELAPYPVGARVAAWLDPALPDKAFLIREESKAPHVFIVLGLLSPFVAWFAGLLV